MRLSYTPISLLQFFLVAFLTLFLQPCARAQSILAVNYQRHHFENNHTLVEVAGDESIQPETISEKYTAEADNKYPPAINFLRCTITTLTTQNSCKIYAGYHPLRVRIYSTNIRHSMRITVKLFKVVIVPMWRGGKSRAFGN